MRTLTTTKCSGIRKKCDRVSYSSAKSTRGSHRVDDARKVARRWTPLSCVLGGPGLPGTGSVCFQRPKHHETLVRSQLPHVEKIYSKSPATDCRCGIVERSRKASVSNGVNKASTPNMPARILAKNKSCVFRPGQRECRFEVLNH